MSGPTSYWLPDGMLVFAYDTQEEYYPPWIIAKMAKRGSKRNNSNTIKSIVRNNDGSLKRYKTEEEARAALYRYAKKRGLKPAY